MIQDAKDVEEATSYLSGNGTAPNPEGLLTAATIVVNTASTATFASVDLDATEEALPSRFQSRAQWLGNRSIYNLVRHFDSNNGPDLWVRIAEGLAHGGNTGRTLLGYRANELSTMGTTHASADPLLVFGDFGYFLIVDRIGMQIELVPHLFATANNRPSGQRGLFRVLEQLVQGAGARGVPRPRGALGAPSCVEPGPLRGPGSVALTESEDRDGATCREDRFRDDARRPARASSTPARSSTRRTGAYACLPSRSSCSRCIPPPRRRTSRPPSRRPRRPPGGKQAARRPPSVGRASRVTARAPRVPPPSPTRLCHPVTPEDPMHPATEAILAYFTYDHLPARLQDVSAPFAALAQKVATGLDGPEATVCLRKLLEAKDCAVRARRTLMARILWHSVAPWAGSGYGQQTRVFAPRVRDLGHHVAISAYLGARRLDPRLGRHDRLPERRPVRQPAAADVHRRTRRPISRSP